MHGPWNTPVVKSLMWIFFSLLMLFVRSCYKKNRQMHTVYFFSNKTTQCTSIDLWGRNGISQDIGRTDFKGCSRETWNCCKPCPWRTAMKIVLSSLLSSVLKYNLFKRRMLISSESCNCINLYSRLIQSFLARYPATITGNWEKNHKLSRSLIDSRLCKPHSDLINASQFPGWEESDYQ